MPELVVVTDYGSADLKLESDILQPAGLKVTGFHCRTVEDCRNAVADADYVIVQFAPVKRAAVEAMRKAKIIVRYGIGVDNVDLDAAREMGIPVCNVPDYCIDEVADQTLAFILAATRQVVACANTVRSGQWKIGAPVSGFRTLSEQTVGVIGFGRIGRQVVRRVLGFGSKVVVFDPVVPAADISAAGAQPAATLDDVLKQADILTLHCPSSAKTRKIINADSLAKMRRGAILINVGRGDLVDSPALMEVLRSGQLSMAMLDVFDPEPVPADHPILKMEQVVMASHIASVSPNAVKRLRETAAQLVLRAQTGQPLINVVNGVTKPRAL